MNFTREERDQYVLDGFGSATADKLAADCNELEEQRNDLNAKLDAEMATSAGLRAERDRLRDELHIEIEKRTTAEDQLGSDLNAVTARAERSDVEIDALAERAREYLDRVLKAELERDAAIARAERAEIRLKKYEPINLFNGLNIEQWKERAEKAERERDEMQKQVTHLLSDASKVSGWADGHMADELDQERRNIQSLAKERDSAIAERDRLREELARKKIDNGYRAAFVMGELHGGSEGMPCEHTGCTARSWSVFLTAVEWRELWRERHDSVDVLIINQRKLGRVLCDAHSQIDELDAAIARAERAERERDAHSERADALQTHLRNAMVEKSEMEGNRDTAIEMHHKVVNEINLLVSERDQLRAQIANASSDKGVEQYRAASLDTWIKLRGNLVVCKFGYEAADVVAKTACAAGINAALGV